MYLLKLSAALALLGCALLTHAADGLVAVKSPHSAQETMNRLEATVKERGLNVFARIDHAAGASRVGKTLRPTELLIFGNPQGGTPLMECAQTAGIDLPLKALVWQDASAQVWLGYNDPAFLAQRHGAPACPVVDNLRKALSGIADAVIARCSAVRRAIGPSTAVQPPSHRAGGAGRHAQRTRVDSPSV